MLRLLFHEVFGIRQVSGRAAAQCASERVKQLHCGHAWAIPGLLRHVLIWGCEELVSYCMCSIRPVILHACLGPFGDLKIAARLI